MTDDDDDDDDDDDGDDGDDDDDADDDDDDDDDDDGDGYGDDDLAQWLQYHVVDMLVMFTLHHHTSGSSNLRSRVKN